jgi:hypothetical protein
VQLAVGHSNESPTDNHFEKLRLPLYTANLKASDTPSIAPNALALGSPGELSRRD